MTLPANFGRAIDLSGLGKPASTKPLPSLGKEVTPANLTAEFLPLSRIKPVILICWSARSPESLAVLEILAKLELESSQAWALGSVNVDTEPQVAQALQARTVPYAIAIVTEQLVPLFEQSYPEAQIRLVIEKVLVLASEQGVGAPAVEHIEPEEEQALAALEAGDYSTAESAYKKLLARKPQDPLAKIGLAQTQLLIRTASLDAKTVIAAASAQPNNVDIQIQSADLEISSGDVDGAFNRLLACVRALNGDDQSRVKNHLLELFSLVDPADPRLVKARSALANALF